MNTNGVGYRRAGWTTAIATCIVAIATTIGVILIIPQIKQLTRQNDVLENTLRQTYRPLGILKSGSTQDADLLVLRYAPSKEKNKWSFGSEHFIYNYGKGILLYIGSFSYMDTAEINFKTEFINENIRNVKFDGLYSHLRRFPIIPGDSFQIAFNQENLDFQRKYYFYTFCLYEDQGGGLYSTEKMFILNFLDTVIQVPFEDSLTGKKDIIDRPQLTSESPKSIQYFSYYTEAERQKVIDAIKGCNHPMADALEER